MSAKKLPLVVTMGDPCGIGPDIILSAWTKRGSLGLPEFYVTGSLSTLKRRAQKMGMSIEFESGRIPSTTSDTLCVLEIQQACSGHPAVPGKEDSLATIEAIDLAAAEIRSGYASGMVTCPINKKSLYEVGFSYPGHTEYLAELSKQFVSTPTHPVMMIAGPQLRTIPVTIHIPLKDVIPTLSQELIEITCKIVEADLKRFFGIVSPKLAVAGLNPHAGEEGTIGLQDSAIIAPAVANLKSEGMSIVGPLPADTMFHAAAREKYDAAICMYHDQALIPAKTLGFDEAVNVTLGLPFLRTSPDHGTAYDIAGTGNANPSSFVAALKMADEMAIRA